MKVICDRGALLDAINIVSGVVPARTPTPALSCVRISASDDDGPALELAGSDGETSIQLTIHHVQIERPGSVAVPADKLRQIISAEEGEPTLTLEADDDLCHIKGQDAHFQVFCYPADDFPALPDLNEAIAGDADTNPFSFKAEHLVDLIGLTTFATARETSRYAINGVLLKREGKKVEMVATDGRRLAVARTQLSGQHSKDTRSTCIVPTKALNLASKLVENEAENVQIVVTPNRVYFAYSGPSEAKEGLPPRAVLTSALVEGAFPPYEDVIPKDQDKKVVASREELSRAVRKAAVLTNEESRGVRMAFSGSGKSLTLSSRAPEMGEAEITVDLASYDGDDIEISFNPAFITDVLRVVEDQEVIVELKDPKKPGLIRSAGADYTYVVMPVNLT